MLLSRQAIATGNPNVLKMAMISANRLNATSIPEYTAAVQKYREVKKLLLQITGHTMKYIRVISPGVLLHTFIIRCGGMININYMLYNTR